MSLKSRPGSPSPESIGSRESIGKEYAEDSPRVSVQHDHPPPVTSKSGVYLIPQPTNDPNDPLVGLLSFITPLRNQQLLLLKMGGPLD